MLEKALHYGKKVIGSINGWDRVRFRGTIRWLSSIRGMETYLQSMNVLLKDFKTFASEVTSKIRSECEQQAKAMDVPFEYLRSSAISKEKRARQIALERKVDTGDICMFSVVEPCYAPTVCGNRREKTLEVQMRPRKCIFIYHYWNDPDIGFGHTRLQTWLPLSVTVCINGRHWLERQLINAGIDYVKDGNCFPFIADLSRAQELLNEQLKSNWPELLDSLLKRNCPGINNVISNFPLQYYWSADETEWASDIMFESAKALDQIFPTLLRYGMLSAQSPEVMRFFGRKVVDGVYRGRAPDEIVSDLRKRYEGVRIKHRCNNNSVKMYNKAGSILRVETTINNTRDFKVFRQPNDDDTKRPSWQKMRKGVSDLHRRAEVSQACNKRYVDHLEKATITDTLHQTVSDTCQPVIKNSRRHRAINPWRDEDFNMLQFIALGEHSINGFRNKNMRSFLYPGIDLKDKMTRRKMSARVTRRLTLLRAHGLIRKITGTTRYHLTAKGKRFASAIMASAKVDTQQLMEMAV